MIENSDFKCDYGNECKFRGKYNDAIAHLKTCDMILQECYLKCGNFFNSNDLQVHSDFLCENLEVVCENCDEYVKPN
jgi:hypothetical protein